jgi:hypothetical protein
MMMPPCLYAMIPMTKRRNLLVISTSKFYQHDGLQSLTYPFTKKLVFNPFTPGLHEKRLPLNGYSSS